MGLVRDAVHKVLRGIFPACYHLSELRRSPREDVFYLDVLASSSRARDLFGDGVGSTRVEALWDYAGILTLCYAGPYMASWRCSVFLMGQVLYPMRRYVKF